MGGDGGREVGRWGGGQQARGEEGEKKRERVRERDREGEAGERYR